MKLNKATIKNYKDFCEIKKGIFDIHLRKERIEKNDPEKKIPSTAAKAMHLSPNEELSFIQFIAQSAFFLIDGIVSIALNNLFFL